MTLCIGARCHYGGFPRLILCSDEQAGTESVTFDDVVKCDYLCEGFAALFSGSTGAAKELMRRYKAELRDTRLESDTVVQKLSDVYGNWRASELDRAARHSLGMSFEQAIQTENCDVAKATASTVEVVIAGFLAGLAVVFQVDENRVTECDHFAVIGTGWQGAETMLSFRGYSSDSGLDHALYLVYEAKRFAEISPHVGKQTTLLVLEPKDEYAFTRRVVINDGIDYLGASFNRYGPRPLDDEYSFPFNCLV